MLTIYHNNRCSKSRQTLSLIENKGISAEIIHYLDTPPDKTTLQSLTQKLGLDARSIIRNGEEAYKQLNLKDPQLTDDDLLEAIAAHPKLLQRPIVVSGDKAIIGRPPENVLALLTETP